MKTLCKPALCKPVGVLGGENRHRRPGLDPSPGPIGYRTTVYESTPVGTTNS